MLSESHWKVNKSFSAGIYLFKVKNGSTRTMYEICSRLTKRYQKDVRKVILLSLLLTLNRFHTLLWCFYRSLGTSKYSLSCAYIHLNQNLFFIYRIYKSLHQSSFFMKLIAFPRMAKLQDKWKQFFLQNFLSKLYLNLAPVANQSLFINEY